MVKPSQIRKVAWIFTSTCMLCLEMLISMWDSAHLFWGLRLYTVMIPMETRTELGGILKQYCIKFASLCQVSLKVRCLDFLAIISCTTSFLPGQDTAPGPDYSSAIDFPIFLFVLDPCLAAQLFATTQELEKNSVIPHDASFSSAFHWVNSLVSLTFFMYTYGIAM